jgi:Methyltransferase domain
MDRSPDQSHEGAAAAAGSDQGQQPPTRLFGGGIERFTNVIYSDSHGAIGDFLGAGYLYYGCAAALKSQVSVCIGSGGGFVPALLAQAQRDLGLRPAATYLVDANLPEVGFGSPLQPGGWMRPENDFLRSNPDIFVLPMLSHDAARLFAGQGVSIDYLHIDGDHSRRGVVADFEDFAPLVSPRGIVSLHDLGMPGVEQAIEEILARHPGWECLRFGELGAGTALLRRRAKAAAVSVDATRRVLLDPGAVETGVAESERRARFERWHYLDTPAYRVRYSLVADFIDRQGGTVVEIGGFPNSVVDFLHRSARLVAIEPYAPDAYVQRVEEAARQRGIDFLLSPGTVARPLLSVADLPNFALVWLGVDPTCGCDDIVDFLAGALDLAHRAEIAAFEFPDHAPSLLVWRLVEECLAPAIERDLTLDLSADPVGDEFAVEDWRAKRRVVLFRTTVPPPDVDDEKIVRCAERLAAILARGRPSAGGVNPHRHRFSGGELPSVLGRCSDGFERVARPESDQPGCLTYGPYLRLPAGRYRAAIRYASPAPAAKRVGAWDVCVGVHNVIARGPLPGTGGETAERIASFGLSAEQAQFPVELRTHFAGTAALHIQEIEIEKTADEAMAGDGVSI